MRFLSLFSGIEAASQAWIPIGWECVGVAEIDPFPCAVLAHHYPDVPNLGDITKITDDQIKALGHIDIVVGGAPCQSFSIAGLRNGLRDPRGNLTLEWLRIVELAKPRFIFFENVPGMLSDKTRALHCLLDGLEELGYAVDVDILDAQFHGLAQRRRRVFVVGEGVSHLATAMTDSSALTIGQALLEILHGILVAHWGPSTTAPGRLASPEAAKDGLTRRMKLFGLGATEAESCDRWREILAAAFQRSARGQSDCLTGSVGARLADTNSPTGGGSSGSGCRVGSASESWNTGVWWKNALAAISVARRLSTTSTATSPTTPAEIYTCSRIALDIAWLITRLSNASPVYWSAASSALTALRGFIDYARFASSDLFGDLERVHSWRDFIAEAQRTSDALGNIGIECFGAVLPISESLRGDSPPSRKAGQGVAPTISARTKGGGGLGTDFDCDGGLIPELPNPLTARMHKGINTTCDEGQTPIPVPAVPVGVDCYNGAITGDVAATMGTMGSPINSAGPQVAVAFAQNQRDEVRLMDVAGALAGEPGMKQQTYLHQAMQVRRLVPEECEKLQGFPPGFTKIPYRGKPADKCPDGPRYKALGNSFAVPVVSWIGRRIAEVSKI